MGKKTLYHPISLHVIRGAAEYCGWKFGKLNQIAGDIETGHALYIAEIVIMPRGASLWPESVKLKQLQHCFMDDIKVVALSQSFKGKWRAKLSISLKEEVDQEFRARTSAPLGQPF
jgi:hypothetical protein